MGNKIIVDDIGDLLPSNDCFETVISHLGGGIALWDPQFKCRYVNLSLQEMLKIRVTGPDRDTLNIQSLVSDEDLARFLEDPGFKNKICLYRGKHADCNVKYLSVSISAVLDRQNLLLGYLTICRDVTESYQTELSKKNHESGLLRDKLQRMNLNQKQIQILEILVQGETNKGIANAVHLSEQGVKYHIGNLLEKFHTKNRSELRSKIYELMLQP